MQLNLSLVNKSDHESDPIILHTMAETRTNKELLEDIAASLNDSNKLEEGWQAIVETVKA